jgi:hypothetical protein
MSDNTITIDESDLEQLVEQKVQERAAEIAEQTGMSRRRVLASLAGIAGAGALGYTGGQRVAADPSDAAGTVYFDQVGDSNNPVSELYVDQEFAVDENIEADTVEMKDGQVSNALSLDDDPTDDQSWALYDDANDLRLNFQNGNLAYPWLNFSTDTDILDIGSSLYDVDLDLNGGNIDNVGKVSTERLDTTPTLNHIATLGDSDLGRPHDIEIADGLAVIPGKDGNVSVVSLYPRNSPTLLGTDTSFSNAQAVAKYPGRNERYMWAVADDANLQTVLAQANGAVSSISSASLSTSQANGTAWYKGQESEPVSLFVAEKGGELSAYDMSGYDSISQTVTEPVNSTTPHDVAVMDTRVITCSQADGASPSVEVLNAISGSGTNIQPSLSTDGMITDPALNGANRLERYGHYVIVAANRADTLSAIDLSDFTNPTIADSVPTAGHASGLTVVGDFAITASQGTIEVFDISDPTAISLVDSDSASGAADHDMAVDGRFLYVTGQSADELQVCKIGFEYATTSRAQDLTHGSS